MTVLLLRATPPRTVIRAVSAAAPAARAGVLSVIYVISYLAFGLPPVLASGPWVAERGAGLPRALLVSGPVSGAALPGGAAAWPDRA